MHTIEERLQGVLRALAFYANENNYNDDGAPFTEEYVHECRHECERLDLGNIAILAFDEYAPYYYMSHKMSCEIRRGGECDCDVANRKERNKEGIS